MSTNGNDLPFEEYLGGDSELSAIYREGATALPPAHLDSAICRAARLSAEERTAARWWHPGRLLGKPGSPFGGRWTGAMVAASVVVVTALAVTVSDQIDNESLPSATEQRADQPLLMPVDDEGRPMPGAKAKRRKDGEASTDTSAVPASIKAGPLKESASTGAVPQSMSAEQALSPEEASVGVRGNSTSAVLGGAAKAAVQPPGASSPAASGNISIPPPAVPTVEMERKARSALEKIVAARDAFESRQRRIIEERQLLGRALEQAPARLQSGDGTGALATDRPAAKASPSRAARPEPGPAISPAPSPAIPPATAVQAESISHALRVRESVGVALNRVRALINAERLPEARELLQQLLRQDAGLDVPQDIRDALSAP